MKLPRYPYYIGGEFKESKDVLKVVNPATEETWAEIFEAPCDDIERAIEKARIAQGQWRRISYAERAKALRQIKKVILDNLNILAELESKEIGKPFKESLFVDIPLAADCFDYYAGFLENLTQEKLEVNQGIDFIDYEPFGICAVFLPYNVPLMIFGFSVAAALAAGNAVVIKPSEFASLSLLELAGHLDSLDLPKGLVNVVTGRGESCGAHLAQAAVDLIFFTGSRQTLKKIVPRLQAHPKKVICELGGCNIACVFADADLARAVDNLLAASFIKAGQMCIGVSLILVQEELYADFMSAFLAKVKKIKIGDPFDPQTGMGPLISKEHLLSLQARIAELESKGAKILCGGRPLGGKGFFYPPTVIEVPQIIYEEFFAPVVMVKGMSKEKIEATLAEAPKGLLLHIWSKDIARATFLAKESGFGTVWINTFGQISAATAFGGMGESGWGRNLGRFGFFEYIQPKHIGIGIGRSVVEGWFGI